MSDLNLQPGMFDDLDDAPIDEPELATAPANDAGQR